MNRKSWTRTWESFRLQVINRSSHQARCHGEGPRPIHSKSSRLICRVLLSSASASSAPGMVLVLKLATLEPDTVVMDARTPELGGTTRILITAPSSIVRTQVHVEISGRSRKTRRVADSVGVPAVTIGPYDDRRVASRRRPREDRGKQSLVVIHCRIGAFPTCQLPSPTTRQ